MKFRLLMALSLAIAGIAFQDAMGQEMGVIAGFNVATLTGRVYSSPTDGVAIGGYVRSNLFGPLSLESEILFSTKGGHMTVDGSAYLPVTESLYVPTTGTLTLDYVEVPVLIMANVQELPLLPAGLDVFAGPALAVNVISKDEAKAFYNDSWHGFTPNYSSEIQRFSFNIEVGGGPNFKLGRTIFGIEMRYTFSTGSAVKNFQWNNNVWSIMGRIAL